MKYIENMIDYMKKSPSVTSANKNKNIRLAVILGPFEYVYRNLLSKAKLKNQTVYYHHTLSCFEVEIRVYIGSLHLLHKKTFASDSQNSLTPFFNFFHFNLF
jgi:hypothetical protein